MVKFIIKCTNIGLKIFYRIKLLQKTYLNIKKSLSFYRPAVAKCAFPPQKKSLESTFTKKILFKELYVATETFVTLAKVKKGYPTKDNFGSFFST